MNKLTVVILLLVALLTGAALGYWLVGSAPAPTVAPATGNDREPLFYRNPMNPQVTSPVPAKDNMGMDYIPVYADARQDDTPAGTVRIDPVTTQSMGVRTALAERRSLSRDIQTLGRVDYDEQRITRLHPKIEGWIDEQFIETTGESIRKDEILLSIYSPKLVSTQQEYLLALSNYAMLSQSPFEHVGRDAASLLETTEQRLRLMDVPEHQIAEIKASRNIKKQLHIHSPVSGVVIHVGVREGQYVTPQNELYFIADLTRVWVYVDIYEQELPWVQVGDQAEMQVDAAPGRTFTGKLTYIYPYTESNTRTTKARLEFDNDDLLLKPNMFADVRIRANPRADAVAVPIEAVVRSGLREKLFVVRAPGQFEPREVEIGISSNGWTEILEGIAAGERVVTSAQFLIDSESKLTEAAAKLMPAGERDSANDSDPSMQQHEDMQTHDGDKPGEMQHDSMPGDEGSQPMHQHNGSLP